MKSNSGFKSGEWTNGDQIWTGRLRVVEKGSHTCRILLEDAESGELFAECPFVAGKRSATVFDASDSSRYFVLRIQGEGGRHACHNVWCGRDGNCRLFPPPGPHQHCCRGSSAGWRQKR